MESKYQILFFLILLVVLIIWNQKSKSSTKTKLRNAYQDALKGGNKEKALQAGRAYYGSLRKGTLTIYDEQAINNDMKTMVEKSTSSFSSIEQLEKLANLKNQGVLTEEEFLKEKSRILNN